MGLCIATKEAVQNMKANNTQGHIIHINSIAGHVVMDFPGTDVYTASKHAVTALAETLRLEVNREKLPIKVTVSLYLHPIFYLLTFNIFKRGEYH